MPAPLRACGIALAITVFTTGPGRTAEAPAVEQGLRLFEQGQFAQARAGLMPAATAKPPSTTAEFTLGRIAMSQDDAKEAARWSELAIKANDRNSAYHSWLGRAYGSQAQHAGTFSMMMLARKTKSEFDRAVALDPDNLDARDGLVTYYLEAPGIAGGRSAGARERFGRGKRTRRMEREPHRRARLLRPQPP